MVIDMDMNYINNDMYNNFFECEKMITKFQLNNSSNYEYNFYNSNANPISNPISNHISNHISNPNISSINNHIIKLNKEFRDYIIQNFNNNCIYNKIYDRISFKLIKICNVKSLIDKVTNSKSNNFNDLEYRIHKIKIINLIENILLLMSYKNYYFDFGNYDYQLCELENNNSIDKLYFIKIKKNDKSNDKKNNKNNDKNNDNDNDNDNNSENSENKNILINNMWLFHKDIMLEYIKIMNI
jgi:hypothetical protein